MTLNPPRLGDPVVFHPRVPYGRQNECAAQITKVWDAEKGDVDLIMFPAGGEPQRINHAARASDTIKLHCWTPVVDPRLEQLEAAVRELQASVKALLARGQAGQGTQATAGQARR